MRMYDILAKKRDGEELTHQDLSFFVKGVCDGSIPDYQVSALLMAIFIRGLNLRETADLTFLMAESGDSIDLSAIEGIKVDKHSTGGVGDKTTLVLGPIVAACGVPVAKMSGRGLGHTGGTIDKLESIHGFRTAMTRDEFIKNVREIGICIASQTGDLAPADKKLYALRDVTATVDNKSLIASSIMSKKIASGADKIVLDVKTGSGAFMKTLDDAVELASIMVDIGKRVGRETAAVVTDMDVPLGNAIGNSLEVIEAVDTLKGNGPSDLESVSLELAARMLELAGTGDYDACRLHAQNALKNGSALKRLGQMIERQGGDPGVLEDYTLLGRASSVYDVVSEQSGYIKHMETGLLGAASVQLGAGRETKESPVDPSAGILLYKKTGAWVEKGEALARLFSNDPGRFPAAAGTLKRAFSFSPEPPGPRPLILYHSREHS